MGAIWIIFLRLATAGGRAYLVYKYSWRAAMNLGPSIIKLSQFHSTTPYVNFGSVQMGGLWLSVVTMFHLLVLRKPLELPLRGIFVFLTMKLFIQDLPQIFAH